jgi:hypothetical protein
MVNQANPLAKHFRQPALYLALPSKGMFYPEGTVELSATGTVPIYPMTVKDELALKTPDALLNGQAVIDVIRSCCPAIKDPWEIPSVDLDPLFIAMRLASYGKAMDFTASCPHCKETHDYSIDLNMVLDSVGRADFSKPFSFDGLTFRFKPQKYQNINKVGMIGFEQEKLIQNVVQNDTLTEEEKMTEFKKGFEKIRQLNIDTVVDSIDSITTEDGTKVSDRDMIAEFLDSCSRQVYENIKNSVQELTDAFKIAPLSLQCDNEQCGKEFSTGLTFDHSNFFG